MYKVIIECDLMQHHYNIRNQFAKKTSDYDNYETLIRQVLQRLYNKLRFNFKKCTVYREVNKKKTKMYKVIIECGMNKKDFNDRDQILVKSELHSLYEKLRLIYRKCAIYEEIDYWSSQYR